MIKKLKPGLLLILFLAIVFCSMGVFALDGSSEEMNEGTSETEFSNNLAAVVMGSDYLIQGEEEEQSVQQIAVVLDETIPTTEKTVLLYVDDQGRTGEIPESRRTDKAILYEKDFSGEAEGVYQLTGICAENEDADGTEEVIFDEVEIEAEFSVMASSDAENIAEITLDDPETLEEDIVSGMENALAEASADTEINAETDADSNIVVVLDPGHGGDDPGACYYGLQEKDLNLIIAKACKEELEQYQGVEVYMVREDDTEYLAREIIAFATSKNADLLVSIHNNAGGGEGFEIYYPNANYRPEIGQEGYQVAESIRTELAKLGLNDRGTKTRTEVLGVDDDYYDCEYPDGSAGDWYFINRWAKEAGYIGIIVEHAFMDSYSDYANYLSSETQLKKMGVADATGIANYYGLSKSVAVTGVTLSRKNISLTIGKSAELTATISPSNATNQTVTWSSSNTKVAKVVDGKVTATGTGSAKITVKTQDGSKTATCRVSVSCAKGDLNADGEVNLADAEIAKKAAMQDSSVNLTSVQKKAGDLDGNGIITINEARKIKRAALGQISLSE